MKLLELGVEFALVATLANILTLQVSARSLIGHSEYFGQGGHRVVSLPMHEVLSVAETGQRETFLQHCAGTNTARRPK